MKDRGKEFEGSYTRVIFIMIVTYCTLFGYMTLIGSETPYLNAIVPTVGFNISTWSLPFVKEIWISFKERNDPPIQSGLSTVLSGSITNSDIEKGYNQDDISRL